MTILNFQQLYAKVKKELWADVMDIRREEGWGGQRYGKTIRKQGDMLII
jgi:hypothetical protein